MNLTRWFFLQIKQTTRLKKMTERSHYDEALEIMITHLGSDWEKGEEGVWYFDWPHRFRKFTHKESGATLKIQDEWSGGKGFAADVSISCVQESTGDAEQLKEILERHGIRCMVIKPRESKEGDARDKK